MDEFFKMDVFFAVTTVVAVVLGIFGAIVLWRLERVLKNIEHIAKRVAIESDNVHDDLVELRSDIRRGKGKLKALFSFFKKFPKRASKKS